jgi:polyisoprenoid-binding protein YceI
MKRIFLPIITAALLIGGVSCNETNPTKNSAPTNNVEEKKQESAVFSYNHDSTKISWEAFKTTEKKGVKGEFSSFEISGTKDGNTPKEVFSDASFVIQTSSVNTGMELRDNRIVNSFFNIFVNTETITGKVKSLNDTTGILEISLNEITNNVSVAVLSDGNKFSLEGEINLGLFNGQTAIDSLNYVCKDVHKGADGITKLWPDVKINVSTTLTSK